VRALLNKLKQNHERLTILNAFNSFVQNTAKMATINSQHINTLLFKHCGMRK